jgi:hypothetical protein
MSIVLCRRNADVSTAIFGVVEMGSLGCTLVGWQPSTPAVACTAAAAPNKDVKQKERHGQGPDQEES